MGIAEGTIVEESSADLVKARLISRPIGADPQSARATIHQNIISIVKHK